MPVTHPFHLAFPVTSLETTRSFYGGLGEKLIKGVAVAVTVLGAQVAINGDFFDHDFGLNVGNGMAWPFPDTDHRAQRWTRMELEHRIDQIEAIRFLVKGDVKTLRGAAVRFALASHVVSSAVLGPRTVTQLEELVRETGGGPRYLRDEDLGRLYTELEKVGVRS